MFRSFAILIVSHFSLTSPFFRSPFFLSLFRSPSPLSVFLSPLFHSLSFYSHKNPDASRRPRLIEKRVHARRTPLAVEMIIPCLDHASPRHRFAREWILHSCPFRQSPLKPISRRKANVESQMTTVARRMYTIVDCATMDSASNSLDSPGPTRAAIDKRNHLAIGERERRKEKE